MNDSKLNRALALNRAVIVKRTLELNGRRIKNKCSNPPSRAMGLGSLEMYMLDHCLQKTFREKLRRTGGWLRRFMHFGS